MNATSTQPHTLDRLIFATDYYRAVCVCGAKSPRRRTITRSVDYARTAALQWQGKHAGR